MWKIIGSILCFFGRHKWSEPWKRFEYPLNVDGYVRIKQKVCLRRGCYHRSETLYLVKEYL